MIAAKEKIESGVREYESELQKYKDLYIEAAARAEVAEKNLAAALDQLAHRDDVTFVSDFEIDET